MKFLKSISISLAFSTLTLTGCSSLPHSKVEKVDCVAKYTTGTWPTGSHWVKIDQRRINHVGHHFVHVKSDLILYFYGRWQREELFTDYQCKKVAEA
ncbi:TPA: hypothetical protein ACJJYX_004331 [Enterobacter cloacae]